MNRVLNAGMRLWGQGRLLEAEEESYFNTDDDGDEDDVSINLSNAFPRINSSLKRKRALSGSVRSQVQRPPPVVIPSLGSLVDYDDGEDLGGFGDVKDTIPSLPHISTRISGSPGPQEMPTSQRPAQRLRTDTKPLEPVSPEDPEDTLLESLLSKSNSPGRPPELGLGAKRPRDDEDDELLAIATKAKRPSMGGGVGNSPAKEAGNGGGITIKLGGVKAGDEGPKKIKLKLSSPNSMTPSPSSTGVKDGDTG